MTSRATNYTMRIKPHYENFWESETYIAGNQPEALNAVFAALRKTRAKKIRLIADGHTIDTFGIMDLPENKICNSIA